MYFLNPLWFFGLLSLSIPILIHLIHQNQGKVFKVGSIILWDHSPRKSQKALKLKDWILLCLRCLLLTLLMVILAEWMGLHKPIKNPPSWILLPSKNGSGIYKFFKKSLDSLVLNGYEPHLLDSQFTRISSLEGYFTAFDSLKASSGQDENYLESVKKLDKYLPKGGKAYFFTDQLKSHFRGNLGPVSYSLNWRFWNERKDSIRSWIKAWRDKNQSLQGMGFYSNLEGTGFYTHDLNPEELKKQANLLDTSTLSIAILYDKHSPDLSYLESAIRTSLSYLPGKSELNLFENPEEIKKNYTWIFWIKNGTLPKTLPAYSENLFQYAPGREVNLHSYMVNGSLNTPSWAIHPISLYKSISSEPAQTQKLRKASEWEDGLGGPILTRDTLSGKTLFTFYSRFNPNWNDLVWSESFPAWIIHLLSKAQSSFIKPNQDLRGVWGEIPITQTVPFESFPLKNERADKNLPPILGMVFILLFLFERILSHKTESKSWI